MKMGVILPLAALSTVIAYEAFAETCSAGKSAAYEAAQIIVKREIVNPDFANFPDLGDRGVVANNYETCRYLVVGFVDTVLESGATVRKRWVVELEHQLTDLSWNLMEVEISDW